MFINDVNKKEEIKNIAIRHLRKYGIKFRDKNSRQVLQVTKCKKFFKVPLQSLPHQTVTLKNGQQLVIPKQLYEICCLICRKIETEGIFRKEGSKSRQNEIKLLLDRGCLLGDDHHVIDVAVVLKYFLRELPEPLIPYSYHELFLRCSLVEKKVETILLACLLLPSEHLNVLSFLMQFLNEVTNHAAQNKMDTYNISILLGPNIFPISEKLAPKNKLMVTRICDIIKLMIEHSKNIGVIPDYIIEQIHASTDVDVGDRSKRRRSGSLTRIFNGLKKIVGNRQEEDAINTVTPDLLLTPSISSSKNKEESNRLQRKHRLKNDENVSKRNGTKAVLERRWSAITHATTFKRKKRNSAIDLPQRDLNKYELENKDASKGEYVQVSKREYEEIKNRVSAIEKRLSLELENVQSTIVCENNDMEIDNIIDNIQSAYEQTLVQAEPLCSGTDQIARRLSRELRIRNSEQKMIRSPSARKIGNMRRRSRELDRPNNKIKNQSVRYLETKQTNSKLARNVPSMTKSDTRLNEKYIIKSSPETPLKQSASFNNRQRSTHIYRNSSTHVSFNAYDRSPNIRTIKRSLFDLEMICDDEIISSEMKKFPALPDNGFSEVIYVNTRSEENPEERKANYDDKVTNRIKVQERSSTKQTISPLRRSNNVRQRGRQQEKMCSEIKRLCKSNKENDFIIADENKPRNVDVYTPKLVPHIKRPMIIKSPKRLCTTPQSYHRNTPMKVLATSNSYSPGVY